MKVKPKEILINVPVVLMFNSEDEAANFASNINTVIHGKVKLKYDYLGRLGNQEAIIFYLQRNDEYHFIRDEFIRLIEQEEMQQQDTSSIYQPLSGQESSILSLLARSKSLSSSEKQQLVLSLDGFAQQIAKVLIKEIKNPDKTLLEAAESFTNWAESLSSNSEIEDAERK